MYARKGWKSVSNSLGSGIYLVYMIFLETKQWAFSVSLQGFSCVLQKSQTLRKHTWVKICSLEIWSLYFLFLWHNKHCLQWINIFTGRGLEKRMTTFVILVNSVREMPRTNTIKGKNIPSQKIFRGGSVISLTVWLRSGFASRKE